MERIIVWQIDWIDAIIAVLAEKRKPMEYKKITKKILDRGYRIASSIQEAQNEVNSILSRHPELFKRVMRGVYELIDTSVIVSFLVPPIAAITSCPVSPIIVRPCTSYPPSDPIYKKISDFIKDTSVLSDWEDIEVLLELIVNFRLPLVNEDEEVCFADILDKLEVQILEEKGSCTQSINAALLEEKLKELNKQIKKIEREIQNNPQREDLYRLRDNMRSAAEKVKKLLTKASNGNVEFEYTILGKFVPDENKPKVIIYKKSIHSWQVMVAVFIHEMFHAWNYFNAAGSNSVLAIDEPMVEFATLYFLKKLEDFTQSLSRDLHKKVSKVDYESQVQNKQQEIGDVAAYGFGYYLFTELSKSDADSIKWIETYSKKSASIKSNELVKNVEDALIPIYPFMSEDEVMEWFEEIIFDGPATFIAAGKSTTTKVALDVSLRKLVLACIKTIGRKCFDAKELYAFAPIFEECGLQYENLENALKQQLDKLVKEGILDTLPPDCYNMK